MGREEEHEVFMVWYFSLVICLQKCVWKSVKPFAETEALLFSKLGKAASTP